MKQGRQTRQDCYKLRVNGWKLTSLVLVLALAGMIVREWMHDDRTARVGRYRAAAASTAQPDSFVADAPPDAGIEQPDVTPKVVSLPHDPHQALYETLRLHGYDRSQESETDRYEKLRPRAAEFLPILAGWIVREHELSRNGIDPREIGRAYGYLGGAAAVPLLERVLFEQAAVEMASCALPGLLLVDDPAAAEVLTRFQASLPNDVLLVASQFRFGSPAVQELVRRWAWSGPPGKPHQAFDYRRSLFLMAEDSERMELLEKVDTAERVELLLIAKRGWRTAYLRAELDRLLASPDPVTHALGARLLTRHRLFDEVRWADTVRRLDSDLAAGRIPADHRKDVEHSRRRLERQVSLRREDRKRREFLSR